MKSWLWAPKNIIIEGLDMWRFCLLIRSQQQRLTIPKKGVWSYMLWTCLRLSSLTLVCFPLCCFFSTNQTGCYLGVESCSVVLQITREKERAVTLMEASFLRWKKINPVCTVCWQFQVVGVGSFSWKHPQLRQTCTWSPPLQPAVPAGILCYLWLYWQEE